MLDPRKRRCSCHVVGAVSAALFFFHPKLVSALCLARAPMTHRRDPIASFFLAAFHFSVTDVLGGPPASTDFRECKASLHRHVSAVVSVLFCPCTQGLFFHSFERRERAGIGSNQWPAFCSMLASSVAATRVARQVKRLERSVKSTNRQEKRLDPLTLLQLSFPFFPDVHFRGVRTRGRENEAVASSLCRTAPYS